MEKERLVIKNFGPIKSVDLELGKMTVLIGDQATGKSTIAKVLAMCRYFSYIISTKIFEENPFQSGLEAWSIDDSIRNGSYIKYECEDYSVEVENENENQLKKPVLIAKSKRFLDLLSQLETVMNETDQEGNNIQLFSAPESFFKNSVSQVLNNPFYIYTERGLQSLFSLGKHSIENISDSLYSYFAKVNGIVSNFKNVTKIEPLNLYYFNENGRGYIKQNNNDSKFIPISRTASGYQSTIPIILLIKYYSEKRNKSKTFIIEEPELNLFPKTQKKLVEFFVESINTNNHSFLIPTHSPYLLSAANDLLLAYKKGEKNNAEVNDIVDQKYWLNPKEFRAYELSGGEAKPIFDEKTGLIGDNMIDEASDEMNDEFDNLLDI